MSEPGERAEPQKGISINPKYSHLTATRELQLGGKTRPMSPQMNTGVELSPNMPPADGKSNLDSPSDQEHSSTPDTTRKKFLPRTKPILSEEAQLLQSPAAGPRT